ncbi:uncharacterized protein [Typha latifolia]|uniref:uncharacterized protein isoform X1 n=1 Tax=Typha latifolia TaxID=4733 RepID=UPI003C2B5553
MIPHRRQELAARNHFSFNNPIYIRKEDWNSSEDMMEYGTWAEGIKGNYSQFGKTGDLQHGAWTQRTRRQRDIDGDSEEFRWLRKGDTYDSDTPSPPLWKSSKLPVARSAETSPVHSSHHEHHYLTPRAQTIAKYRQEMLNMVQDMPETAYELSLRDIVESPLPRIARREEEMELIKEKNEQRVVQKKKEKKKEVRRIARSESLDTGLLIKMFLPLSVGGRKSLSSSGTCRKVSPKPTVAEGQKCGADKNKDAVWWKKNEFSDTSSSRTSSTNSTNSSISSSSNNSNRSRSRKMSGCYSFFHKNKGKARES